MIRALFITPILALGACAGGMVPPASIAAAGTFVAAPACFTDEARLSFDFEGASAAPCVVGGPRDFTLLISPEHAPPINPSPWYAFRYEAAEGAPLTLTLKYLEGRHRYAPKLTNEGGITEIAVRVGPEGKDAVLSLPSGRGTVSAQPILGPAYYEDLLTRLAADFSARREDLGRTLDGRAIEGVRMGSPDAPHLLILLGRQHPPEVTGHYAMEPFLEQIGRRLSEDTALSARYQVVAIPLLNPDGVVHGNWRANRGGVDLNRDWGAFSQPETRAVRNWLASLPSSVRPVMMIDFHSTGRNLFYVQGDEASPTQALMIRKWLEGKERAFPGYDFTLEPRNANPGSGTSKNWFHETYAIPAITYEVGDDTSREAASAAAQSLADTLFTYLDELIQTEGR
ncbi:M14 family metallopeptidase [Qipengyuania sp.]|uniref:M14 family metallopeptidase n=1 Tax=Qipengyuania sp. TaxID=2004515 RepID=UPI0035C81897